ncbi:HAD family hydrolase [Mucilaginibacter terrae]|uniref:Beta-phosphoglucomutase n=1 Tax=Mucilaginibacter terrae TaxID=1955052 RepID=A0ABU3GTA4_9SPHI|nr:HAD family phosphatase [Mucilaginibacter terrae]MDT3402791.1 beta-phosphoglucomutase [Mucilaginibacter terrae]
MYAAIFDMDGTLVDNNPYHFKAWKQLFEQHNRVGVTPELYNEKISGVPGMVIMRNFFGNDHTEEQMTQLFAHKTRNYKEIYAPHVTPINGLERFLTALKNAGFKLAVASSATEANIEFVLSRLPVKHLFDVVVDGLRVSKSKPNPDIFLKAAKDLGVSPENCVVFEDSLSGVKAGNAAGMKVVGITTSHTSDELQPVSQVITDYTELTEHDVKALFE